MKLNLWTLLAVTALCAVVGCNRNLQFGGTVTFSDDNTPVKTGTVCFQKSDYMARGNLDENGHYQLGGAKVGEGLEPGEYKVYLTGTETIEELEMQQAEDGQIMMEAVVPDDVPEGASIMGNRMFVPSIAEEFTNPQSSPLTVTVDANTANFDFTVDRFQQ